MSIQFKAFKGFTLVEVMIVALGIVLLSGVALSASVKYIVHKKCLAESEQLTLTATDIVHTFEDTDFTNINIASLAGEIGGGDIPTLFSTSSTPALTTTNTGDWFAKLAKYRGTPVTTGVAPSRAAQPGLARIIYNGYDRPRLLVAGPTEAGQQRYMLISIMAPSDQLVLPAFQAGQAWFDAIWNTDFSTASGAAPATWAALMTPNDYAAWAGNLYRLRVERITQKRWSFTVNNTHLTQNAWTYWNNGASLAIPANSGPGVISGVLSGRWVRVTTGTVEATASLKAKECLWGNTVVNVD
jgi:hypothetical protein